jgi:uncharacterized membrane protein
MTSRSVMNFVNNSIKAGIFFILPIGLLVMVVLKLVHVITPIAGVVGSIIDPNHKIPFLTVVVTLVFIILILFIAGVLESYFASTKKIITWIENNVLALMPAYQLIKSTSQQKVGVEVTDTLKVVLVPADGWVLAFLVEELPNDEWLIFIPSSPNPYEGSLSIFKSEEVRKTSISPKDAYEILRKTGIGTRHIFEQATIE